MDKKSVLAFVLIFIVILTMPTYFKLITPPPATEPDVIETPATIESHIDKSVPVTPPPAKEFKQGFAAVNEQATVFTIETDLYIAKISSIGGGTIKSFILKHYNMFRENDTTLVDLVNGRLGSPLIIKYISIDGDSVELNNNFKVSAVVAKHIENNSISLSGEESAVLKFSLDNIDKTNSIYKTLTFYGNRYTLEIETDLRNLQREMAKNNYDLVWDGGLAYTEPNISDDMRYSKAYAFSGGETETFDVRANKSGHTNFTGLTSWTAIRTKYFAASFIPENEGLAYSLSGRSIPISGKNYYKRFSMGVSLPVESVNRTSLFVGPLDYTIVKNLGVGLENIMSLGKILRPISKFILWSFIRLRTIIPNYGWVLIIFSIFVKIFLYPLTNKSTQSMKEMQNLAPKIEELKVKYKDDPQKMSAEQMKLYKEHGVNPMGGCLPLLLQMPILIALFTVFRTTIELRHAPFIWWITDLSAPDTIFTLPFAIPIYGQYVNVLPAIMALSTILQQKISGSAGSSNQQQKMMAYMMPIMFFFMFNQFPSGLNLYYTIFNLLSVIQQKFIPSKSKPRKKKTSTLDTFRQIQSKTKRK
jgi:YidC/Oxa1 family membrane protein insertase